MVLYQSQAQDGQALHTRKGQLSQGCVLSIALQLRVVTCGHVHRPRLSCRAAQCPLVFTPSAHSLVFPKCSPGRQVMAVISVPVSSSSIHSFDSQILNCTPALGKAPLNLNIRRSSAGVRHTQGPSTACPLI